MQNPPTHVRWRILVLLMAYAGLLHFNRTCISVAGTEHLKDDYSISETELGIVYSSYLFVYTLCMLPGGWLIDRFGPKKALIFLGFGSAIFVPATGLASFATAARMLMVLCLVRALLGVVSAPMHPGAARAVSFWMPYPARGVANGLITGAAVIGVASTYFIFGFLMDLVGWPAAFLVAGVVTLLLTVVWSVYATDHPAEHRGVNAGERQLIEEGDLTRPSASDPVVPYGNMAGASLGDLLSMFRNRSLVLLTISYATYSYFQYLFFYWVQYYYDKVLELGTSDGRLYATITNLAMAAGMMSGGWLADRILTAYSGWRARAITPICGMTVSAVLVGVGLLGGPTAWVVTCFALSMLALGACESSFWVTGVELGGRRGGLSGAFLNAGGNAGGILGPVVTPLFSDYFGWQAGLGLASVVCLSGAVLWWWIDPYEGRDTSRPALAGSWATGE